MKDELREKKQHQLLVQDKKRTSIKKMMAIVVGKQSFNNVCNKTRKITKDYKKYLKNNVNIL